MSKDTIYRQDAIDALERAIKEDPYYDSNAPINGLGVCDVRVIINDVPSAQPEIIRCKDCVHYYFADNRVLSEQSWVCDAWGVDQTAHMGYCFKAERREE